MKNVDKVCNRILQARGYLVMVSWGTHAIREVVNGVDAGRFGRLKHKLTVIGVTDRQDHFEQCVIAGVEQSEYPNAHYYRVTAE